MKSPAEWRLCVIVDAALARGRPLEELARAAIAGGADAIQLRDKRSGARDLLEQAARLAALCRTAGAAFIVNDRLDIALAADADGLHVGQEDLPAAAARRLLGPGRLLGVSAVNVAQARQAQADGADYLGAGPVFDARATKPDAAAPIGLQGLRDICAAVPLPVLAIGGLTVERAAAATAAGASGVAVISAVLAADDVTAAARALRAAASSPFRP